MGSTLPARKKKRLTQNCGVWRLLISLLMRHLIMWSTSKVVHQDPWVLNNCLLVLLLLFFYTSKAHLLVFVASNYPRVWVSSSSRLNNWRILQTRKKKEKKLDLCVSGFIRRKRRRKCIPLKFLSYKKNVTSIFFSEGKQLRCPYCTLRVPKKTSFNLTLNFYATQIISKVLPFRETVGIADGIIGVHFGKKDRELYQKERKRYSSKSMLNKIIISFFFVSCRIFSASQMVKQLLTVQR